MARRSAQPLLPGPSLSPSPRPGLSWLLFPLLLPPSPSPQSHTKQGHLPPKSHQLSRPPFPPLRRAQKLQARRLLRTAPIFPSRVLFSHRRGAARKGGGKEPGRPPQRQVCTLMLPSFPEREERKGHVRAPRAPPPPPSLPRRSAGGSRDTSVCFHPAASSPGAPLPPRCSSFSLFLSRSGAGIPRARRRRRRRHGSPRRSPCARASPSLGAASRAATKESGGPRARPLLGDPGRSARKAEASWREKASRRRIPMGFFPGPAAAALPAEGVKRRRTTSARRGRDYFLRLGPAAACSALCAVAAGRARWRSGHPLADTWAGDVGGGGRPAELQAVRGEPRGCRRGAMSSVFGLGKGLKLLSFRENKDECCLHQL